MQETIGQSGRLRRFLFDRMTITAVLAAVIVVGVGLRRRSDVRGISPAAFWPMKASWRHCADVVVAGDSRIYRAVSPAAMKAHLPDVRILNYGFSAAGYSQPYIEAVEELLDPASKVKTIILGVSPFSLTPDAVADNGFDDARRKLADRGFVSAAFEPVLAFFEPMSLSDAWRELIGAAKNKHYYQRYGRNGWIASTRVPPRPKRALKEYRRIFRGNRVSEDVTAGLLRAVSRWRRRGIRVFAFRVPSSAAMIELESSLSGFDEAKFVARFTAAGGVWIKMDQAGYHSYDGSHIHSNAAARIAPPNRCTLHSNDAAKLSEDLARKIRQTGRQAD